MAKDSITAVIETITAPITEELGLELVDVEFVKDGGRWILRVFIDKPGGIVHRDCEILSQRLDVILDEKDPIPQTYYLEVSSPGIERPLKKPQDFQRFTGHLINVNTYAPLEGRKKFTGKLEETREGILYLELEDEGKRISIPLKQVSSAKLYVKL
ncbi:MAG: ribosome maturation factor RimP [Desulfocucumaceae bacterium]